MRTTTVSPISTTLARLLVCFLLALAWLVMPAAGHSVRAVSRAQAAPPLPLGVWAVDANGFRGDLNITSVDSQGNLHGTIYGNPVGGFWDAGALKLTFYRIISAEPDTMQIYTGYVFFDQGKPNTYWAAGSFEAFQGTGAIADRVVYGWFALRL